MRWQLSIDPEPFELEWEDQSPVQNEWDLSIWEMPVRMSIANGVRDENRLTDWVFYQGHPELHGRRLQPNEKQLAQEWFDIRNRLVRPLLQGFPAVPAQPAAATRPRVWYDSPLPPSEAARFNTALAKLETMVANSSDPRKWRYECWFKKLRSSDVDDRVIGWHGICPTKGVVPFYIQPCDMLQGLPIDTDQIYKTIRSVADVDTAGPSLGIVTYLKSNIVVSEEMTSLPLENLRVLHDDMVQAIDKLGKWADVPLGGSSSMPVPYVAIKDWIGARQRDPKSIYSCG